MERTVLAPSVIGLELRNSGADPLTIAQISVNDAFVAFEGTTGPIPRLGGATVRLDHPWQDGLPYRVAVLTSTGLVIEHEIPVAVRTPTVDVESVARMALIGMLIGVVPVLLGMATLRLLRRSGQWLARLLRAVTVGLLRFWPSTRPWTASSSAARSAAGAGGGRRRARVPGIVRRCPRARPRRARARPPSCLVSASARSSRTSGRSSRWCAAMDAPVLAGFATGVLVMYVIGLLVAV
ncbi:MAG: hypothetical protein ACT4O0_13205 [Pseudonocardia sp.]